MFALRDAARPRVMLYRRKYITLQDMELFFPRNDQGRAKAAKAFKIFSTDPDQQLTQEMVRRWPAAFEHPAPNICPHEAGRASDGQRKANAVDDGPFRPPAIHTCCLQVVDVVQKLHKERFEIATSLCNTKSILDSLEYSLAAVLHFLFFAAYLKIWCVGHMPCSNLAVPAQQMNWRQVPTLSSSLNASLALPHVLAASAQRKALLCLYIGTEGHAPFWAGHAHTDNACDTRIPSC